MLRLTYLAPALLIALLATACGGAHVPYPLTGKPGTVLVTNLHADMGRSRIYSTHYQLEGLIPICTEVQVLEVTTRQMIFVAEGNRYTYLFDKHLRKSPSEQLDRVLGTQCPDTSGMSEVDQAGIASGRAQVGMTRAAVVLATGTPPDHVNRPDSPEWKYWVNRFNTRRVLFQDDIVTEVVE